MPFMHGNDPEPAPAAQEDEIKALQKRLDMIEQRRAQPRPVRRFAPISNKKLIEQLKKRP